MHRVKRDHAEALDTSQPPGSALCCHHVRESCSHTAQSFSGSSSLTMYSEELMVSHMAESISEELIVDSARPKNKDEARVTINLQGARAGQGGC